MRKPALAKRVADIKQTDRYLALRLECPKPCDESILCFAKSTHVMLSFVACPRVALRAAYRPGEIPLSRLSR